VFLAHFVGGGLDAVLDLEVNVFIEYFDSAVKFDKIFYERQTKTPIPVYLVELKK